MKPRSQVDSPQSSDFFRILIIFLGMILFLLITNVKAEQTIEEQRGLYLQAQKALKAGQLTSFKKLTGTLTDYPLYPYLIHDYIRPRLASIDDNDIINFLRLYNDLPVANDLLKRWLTLLAKRGKWETYLENYTPQNDTVLQCYQLQARIKTNNQSYLPEDIRSVWLAGKSQPEECDPAFALLYKSNLMTPDLVWERVRLAMQNSELRLAGYLGNRLDTAGRKWLDRWLYTYRNPARGTRNPNYEDIPVAREILTHGMLRLTAADINTAINRWESLKPAYTFSGEQIINIERSLAIRAVIKKHPRSKELLELIGNNNVDEDIFHWRLRSALENNDWPALVRWTEGTPPHESIKLRWQYWRARALEKTGKTHSADELYSQLATERDYYGFMAADRIMANYNIGHQSLPEDLVTWNKVSDRPGVKRAREHFYIGNKYYARREWNHVLSDMTTYEMQIAAMVVANWGWHDRTILTLGKAQSYDDLLLRFPIVFKDEMSKYSGMRNLDLGWLYALTRAESAFMTDARSPSGALGLMQVMPATGRQTAKAINFRTYRNSYLLEPEKNITIGSAYLKQMFDRFNNVIVATAAYNAGPNAVARWIPDDECIEPDIWVEKIPYIETRKYVARVLFFSTLYDWRLKDEVIRINNRMSIISPKRQRSVADLTCPASTNISGL
jgi:soluble lytic murein transglycosylase